jgi:hypothetical protein
MGVDWAECVECRGCFPDCGDNYPYTRTIDGVSRRLCSDCLGQNHNVIPCLPDNADIGKYDYIFMVGDRAAIIDPPTDILRIEFNRPTKHADDGKGKVMWARIRSTELLAIRNGNYEGLGRDSSLIDIANSQHADHKSGWISWNDLQDSFLKYHHCATGGDTDECYESLDVSPASDACTYFNECLASKLPTPATYTIDFENRIVDVFAENKEMDKMLIILPVMFQYLGHNFAFAHVARIELSDGNKAENIHPVIVARNILKRYAQGWDDEDEARKKQRIQPFFDNLMPVFYCANL